MIAPGAPRSASRGGRCCAVGPGRLPLPRALPVQIKLGRLRASGPPLRSGAGAAVRWVLSGPCPGHWGRKLCIGVGNLPTPIGGCLPQWVVVPRRSPRRAWWLPAPMAGCAPAKPAKSLVVACPDAIGRGRGTRHRTACLEHHRTTGAGAPLSQLGEAPRAGRGRSKTRLSLAPSRRHGAGVVQNASQFRDLSRIRANSGRLRRILDHALDQPPFEPGTQTHFGPPDRRPGPNPGQREPLDPYKSRVVGLPNRRTRRAGITASAPSPSSGSPAPA